MHFSTALIALAATASFVSASYTPTTDDDHHDEVDSYGYDTPDTPEDADDYDYDTPDDADDHDDDDADEHNEHYSSEYHHVSATSSAYEHHEDVTYTTEVVTAYVTYCPSPTEIVHGSTTYTVTEPTTLTISDCPCTVSKPVYTSSVTVCSTW